MNRYLPNYYLFIFYLITLYLHAKNTFMCQSMISHQCQERIYVSRTYHLLFVLSFACNCLHRSEAHLEYLFFDFSCKIRFLLYNKR